MYRFLAVASLAAVCFAGASAHHRTKPAPEGLRFIDQGQNDPRLKGYLTLEGVKLEIVAAEPTVLNPVGLTFDAAGNLYVLERVPDPPGRPAREEFVTRTYKDGSTRKAVVLRRAVKDRVKILTPGKGGAYGRAKVVLEDELATGLLVHDGAIYLTGQGTLRKYTRTKPGGAFDKKEVIAQGFDGPPQQSVSGLTLGNDGWLYVTAGGGDNFVEGSDGSRATVLRFGAVFRCRPDGSKVHTFAVGFRGPHLDVAFDAGFNLFLADGSQLKGGRLLHVPEGADYGKALPGLKTGRIDPAGFFVYDDTRFPETYRGLILYPDGLRRRVLAYRVEPSGATFEVTQDFEILKSSDPRFRPLQTAPGPGGAVYVCEGLADAGGKLGRIYRLSWAGTKEQPALPLRPPDGGAKLGKLSDAELLQALESEESNGRQHAQCEIVRRGGKLRPALLKLLDDDERPKRARVAALGALQSFWNDEVQAAFIKLLADAQADVRRLAADGLALNARRSDESVHDALARELNAPDLAVRRAVFLAVGNVAAPAAADTLANALKADDGKDAFLRDGLVRAFEHLGKAGMQALLALADSGVDGDRDKVVEVFLAMRTQPAYEALPVILQNMHLSPQQKAGLVSSYAAYRLDPPVSLEPVAELLRKLPAPADPKKRAELAPVRLAGLEVLSRGGSNDKKISDLLASQLRTLAADAEGALLAGRAFLDGKLAESLRPQVADALRRHADTNPDAARLLRRVLKSD